MSSYSMCNYCRLKELEQLAKAQGKVIVKVQDTEDMGGLGYGESVHLLSNSGEPISEDNFVFWGQEIPEKCEC